MEINRRDEGLTHGLYDVGAVVIVFTYISKSSASEKAKRTFLRVTETWFSKIE